MPIPEPSIKTPFPSNTPHSIITVKTGYSDGLLGSADGVNWAAHTFSPDHVYRYEWPGQGQSVSFMIADHTPFGGNYYGDNSGSLTVSIYTVPEPTALALLAGGYLVAMRRRRK